MVQYKFRLDVTKNGTQGNIYIRKNDITSRSIQARLVDADGAVELDDGNTAVLTAAKPDGTFIYVDMDIDGSYVSCNIPAALPLVSGRVPCQIFIYEDAEESTVLHSPAFTIYVEENVVGDSEIEATSDFSALATAMTQANAYKTKWMNPSVTASTLPPSSPATGSCTVGATGVTFAFGIPKGETGQPAYIGDEPGCLVETTENGVLEAGRKIRVGTGDPEDDTALRDGDLYVQIQPKVITLYSSTTGSTKRFAITVDDSGTISATEVVNGE